MKKIMVILFLLLASLTFTKNLKNVVIYEKDISTGKVIDNRDKEDNFETKSKRYNELKNKKNLSGKEVEEMIKLNEYLTKVELEEEYYEERNLEINAALSEQEVINRITGGAGSK